MPDDNGIGKVMRVVFAAFFITILLAIFALWGVRDLIFPPAPSETPPHDALNALIAPVQGLETNKTGVYFDVRLFNMSGFAQAGKFETYRTCLSYIEGILMGIRGRSGTDTETNYYLVDAALWRVKGGITDAMPYVQEARHYVDVSASADVLREARPENKFEELAAPDANTLSLTGALNYWEIVDEDLSVLVTDFWDRPASNLEDNIRHLASDNIKKGYVFGLTGIRAPFNGSLLTGTQSTLREYGAKESGEAVKLRPFYVMARGLPEKVEAFCAELNRQMRTFLAGKETEYGDGEIIRTQVFQSAYYGIDFLAFDGYRESEKEERNHGLMNPSIGSMSSDKRWFGFNHKTLLVSSPENLSGEGTEALMNRYRFRTKIGADLDAAEPFVFSWTVDAAHRDAFDAVTAGLELTEIYLMAKENGGRPHSVYALPFDVENRATFSGNESPASLWNPRSEEFEPQNMEPPFRVEQLCYEPGTGEKDGKLYAFLRFDDTLLSDGLWKFRWRCVPTDWLEETERWNDWNCDNISDQWTDDSPKLLESLVRTERLKRYVTPMSGQIEESVLQSGQCYLDGALYFDVTTGGA